MKTALSGTGEIIEAGAGVPENATCPLCGRRVTLRKRRTMSGEVTYFWRHVDYKSKSCAKRTKPYKHYT